MTACFNIHACAPSFTVEYNIIGKTASHPYIYLLATYMASTGTLKLSYTTGKSTTTIQLYKHNTGEPAENILVNYMVWQP